MWIDSHAHLCELSDAALADVLLRARNAGVGAVLNTATDLPGCRTVVRQCGAERALFGAAAISPFDIEGAGESWSEELGELLRADRMIAVGETGLDSSHPRAPRLSAQIPFFERQLELARDLDIPAILHSRGAESLTVELCRNAGVVKAVFHCYTGPVGTLRRVFDSGFYVSFSGIVTFRGGPLDVQVRYSPADRIFIETDSPYLAPAPHRGKKNEPAFVPLVGKKIAAMKGMEEERLGAVLAGNFKGLFGFDPLGAPAGSEERGGRE
jgi:TatD DNase family protein